MKNKKYGLHSFTDGHFFEGFQDNEDFHYQKYIGGLLIYVHGKRMVWLCDKPGIKRWRKTIFKTDIWNGCLIASRHHAQLMKALPGVYTHPVIKDSIYLPRMSESYEESMGELIKLIEKNSPLVGVEQEWGDQR